MESAIITDNEHGVAFYGSVGCTGEAYYEVRGPVLGEKCYNLVELLGFVPNLKRLRIICQEVSCHIALLLFSILIRLT